MAKEFVGDIEKIRERDRKHIEDGAGIAGYLAEVKTLVEQLNEAPATEIVCAPRYRRHSPMAAGLSAQGVAAEFLLHANEEQAHAGDLVSLLEEQGKWT